MKPLYTLFIVDKAKTQRKTRAGVIFDNDRGGFNLVLYPGVTISDAMQDRYYLSFYPFRDDRARYNADQSDRLNTKYKDDADDRYDRYEEEEIPIK